MNTANASPVTVHLVGNAHIDPVWLWTVDEGRAEVLSTYRTAIGLIRDFDGYVFTSGGAATYNWVAEDDPALFEAIQQAIAAGKWALVNGWWLQPDCNIPSGESFARHALYGQRFLMQHFGRRAHVGYNVDSFGHAGTLPQLLKLGGLDYYVFFRPGPHEKDLPDGPFWWEAPGGTRVLTCRPPLHYGSPDDDKIVQRIEAAAADAPQGLPIVMCFYGVGNHGGGPTRRNVQAIIEYQQQQDAVRPLFSTPDNYFHAVEGLSDNWPVVHDDLQHHARGCYTAFSQIKRDNRYGEHALMQAERLSTLASVLCQTPATGEEIREAWQLVLFNQFHDILAGTSIRDAYVQTSNEAEQVYETAGRIREAALQQLTANVDVPEREGRPVIVWNPLGWDRTDIAHLALPFSDWRQDFGGTRFPAAPTLRDQDGHEIPCQVTDIEFDYNTYVVHVDTRVTVPALGSRVLYVSLPDTNPPESAPQPPQAQEIANEYYRLRVDPATGWISSLWDIEQQREVLSGPANVPLVIDDPSDTWSHNIASFRDVIGQFRATGPAVLVQDGPVKRTLRVQSAWQSSTIVQDITLYSGSRAVEVNMLVDWHEQHKMLKLAFPLALDAPQVTASAPYGWIKRQPNGEEEPCQAWVDLSGQVEGSSYGLTLVNDSKYGYDALDNELRLSVLRSPIYAFHDPRKTKPGVTYHYTDQGQQTVRYLLVPHAGGWESARPDRYSYELLEPLIARQVAPHSGPWAEQSLLRAEPGHVALTAVKLDEEGRRLLVRGYETVGQAARLTLTSDVLGRRWTYDVAPHQIWTLALPLEGGAPTPLNFLEEEL
jgi:alpha-mannosidase